jgi:spore coat polysaccharide biosynthesis predicted glycosyltransferase SpsG/RimJ/RimL family protein N-acetyltransferase
VNTLPPLVVRADSGPKIGSGHALRALALAQAWTQLSGSAESWGSHSPAIQKRFADAGVPAKPANDDFPPGSWVLIDGYDFTPDYLEKALAKTKTLVMDDYGHRPRLAATVVLNQNAGAEAFPYPHDGIFRLLGPRFALLRPEFAAEPKRTKRDKPRVLVAMGGADPDNATGLVLEALKEFSVTAVLGPDNPHEAKLKGSGAEIVKSVSDLRALMLGHDAAVVAGGVTSLECAAAGLPTVLLTLAENQSGQVAALGKAGVGIALGAERAPGKIAAAVKAALVAPGMGKSGRALVDGNGASRVAKILAAIASPKADEAVLRLAEAQDAAVLWRLANEPSVRANSFTKTPIPLDEHLAWYARQLSDKKTLLFILEVAGAVVAQVRYAKTAPHEAEVHFAVAGAFRGKGLGTMALALSRERASKELKISKVKGLVIEPNPPSAKAFLAAGYTRAGTARERGVECAVFEAAC